MPMPMPTSPPDVALILLGAGAATRMARPKQLLDFDGQPLLRHCARIALASVCRPIVVVLGALADRIRPTLDDLPVRVVLNERWTEGVGTSIQAGLDAVADLPISAIVLTLADQPLLAAATFDALVASHQTDGSPLVASAYAGTVGVPVLFGREHFRELRQLGPDMGCKSILLRHRDRLVARPCPEAETDLDTPADYARWQRGSAGVGPSSLPELREAPAAGI